MPSARAQSETLGFVLVFALMVASIGIVYTAGFSGLQDARDVERVNNAERAFEVLADNMDDITARGAPSRATEIKLADARLYVDDPVDVRINVPDDDFNESYRTRPIVYDADTGERIVYEQGAVLRTRDSSGVVLHESTLLLNESGVVIPIVQLRSSGNADVSGSATVLVRTDHARTVMEYSNATKQTVWMNVTSDRADAWRQYLHGQPDVSCEDVDDGRASCELVPDRIYVTTVKVDIALE